jgi:hypothetical protein
MIRNMLARLAGIVFMPVNECVPFYEAAYTQKLTVHIVTTAAAGKKFVGPLTTLQSGPGLATTAEGGNMQAIGVPAANGDAGGVAAYDAAIGTKVPVIRGAGTMLPVMSGAAVTAGQDLKVDATGRVVPWATGGARVGKAHSTVGAADLEVIVELFALPSQAVA